MTMAARRWSKLKGRMFECGVTQVDLMEATGRGQTYISSRVNGFMPWSGEDMQKIGALLQIPRAEWVEYFIDGQAPGRAV